MALTAQDVHDRQFKLVRQATGYDMDEVDAFLDEVEAEIARLHAELAARPAAAVQVTGGSPTGGEQAGAAARLLELAQRTADELVSESRQRAEAEAALIQQRAAEAVASLESQRAQLEERVARLRSFESDVRTRLRGYLETQLQALDASAQPGE